MRTYLVGGAVRDQLLGHETRDKDFVVTGTTVEYLKEQKFVPVGSGHLVFLHPETREEYTLAECIEKDLRRRDLTVNAIAQDCSTGEIIDPFQGNDDLKKKILRHIPGSFSDDPIRILRLARFACRFPDFTIAPETEERCHVLSQNERLFASVPGERFLLELQKVMTFDNCALFFQKLREWGILKLFFPELDRLVGIPQREDYHPEGDCWIHTLLSLEESCKLSPKFSVRFATLVHDLGKGLTPEDILPSHHKHEIMGVPLVESVCNRFKIDGETKRLALAVCKHHLNIHRALELRPKTLIKVLDSFNSFRQGSLIEDGLICCQADAFGRGKKSVKHYLPASYINQVLENLCGASYKGQIDCLPGKEYGMQVLNLRIKTIAEIRKKFLS